MFRRYTLLFSTLYCCSLPLQAQLNESSVSGAKPTTTGNPVRSRMLEEVIVTVQKREEQLQDVPVSVQAFSAGLLAARGVEEPAQLQQITPGMQYNLQLGYSQIYIRGVGTDAFLPSADATVATYVNGIYYPMAFGANSKLGAIERIEVLKGPQGTLFGRNSTGGAINIVMKQPGQEVEAAFSVSRERFDKTSLNGHYSGPISDTLAFSVGLQWSEAENYYSPSDVSPLKSLPGETSDGYALKLAWNPSDSTTAILGYTDSSVVSGLAGIGGVSAVRPLGEALLVTPTKGYTTSVGNAGTGDSFTEVTTLHLSHFASGFDSKLILADLRNETATSLDFDASPNPVIYITTPTSYYDSKTAELQFLSNDDSWGADWMNWVGGLYYINSIVAYDPIRMSVGAGAVDFLTQSPSLGPLTGLTSPIIDLLQGLPLVDNLLPAVNEGIRADLAGAMGTQSVSAFFQTTINPMDWMGLTLGGRYQTEVRKLVKSTVGIYADAGNLIPPTSIGLLDYGSQRTESNNFSPKVVVDFKLGEDALLYFLYAKGYKSGTYNLVNVLAPAGYVEPEILTSYEIGYKDTLFDGSMRFSAAVFENRGEDVQGQIISFLSGGVASLVNNGSARIRGAEFDSLWEVFPEALPGFVMSLGACYLDGEYTDYKEGSGYDETTGLFFGPDALLLPGRDFTGNTTVRTPELSGSLGLSYTFELGPGMVEVAGDVYYNSGVFFAAQNNEASIQKSYNVVNARASYYFAPWQLRVTAYGTNLGNAEYFVFNADTDFITGTLLAPPAIFGLRLNWEY